MGASTTSPLVTVVLPAVLRAQVGNRASVRVAGHTVREIISSLDAAYPGLKFNLCHETGELRPFVNLFVGRENIRYLQGLDTPVEEGTTLHILQSVAGG
jgi:sulfur-carrier protein